MLKVIYKLNIIPIQIHIMFKESEQKCQDVLTTRHLKQQKKPLEKKEKQRHVVDLKLYWRATVTKRIWP